MPDSYEGSSSDDETDVDDGASKKEASSGSKVYIQFSDFFLINIS